jgi:hypothetical protein
MAIPMLGMRVLAKRWSCFDMCREVITRFFVIGKLEIILEIKLEKQ